MSVSICTSKYRSNIKGVTLVILHGRLAAFRLGCVCRRSLMMIMDDFV